MINKLNRKIKCIISCILILCTVALPLGGAITAYASAESVTELDGFELNGATVLTDKNNILITSSYVTELDNGYNVTKSDSEYALSRNGVGTPFVSFYIDTLGEGGSVLKGADGYNGYDAYGFVAGSGEPIYKKNEETGEDVVIGYNSVVIKLKYNYYTLDNLTGTDGKFWSVSDDTWKDSVNGMDSVGLIGKGAVIVQKFVPTEGKTAPEAQQDWQRLNEFSQMETDGLHTVNFFQEYLPAEHKEPFTVYTPDGNDLQKGVYVKLTVAYELVHTEKKGWWIFSSEKKTFKNVVEETVFYLCNTSAEIVFENIYYDSGSEEETDTSDNVTTKEQKGGAISDNQGAIDGFRVDMRGWNYDVTYRYNNSTNALPCTDGQVFLNTGKYEFVIRSKIGVIRTKTIYIHEKSKAKNVETYFGDGLVSSDSIRIFAPGETYPVYVKDTITLRTRDENFSLVKHAPLVGKVYLLDGDWDSVERNDKGLPVNGLVAEKSATEVKWNYTDLECGRYEAVFVNNEEYFNGTDTGDTYKFVWRFTVVDEGQAPMVNEELLYQQLGFSDYESKFYAVRLHTKGTGDLLIAFTDKLKAYDFACRYLVSNVAVEEDGYTFNGIQYGTESEMLVCLHLEAESMVEKRYFDATDVSTYITLKESILTPILSDTPTEEELKEYNSFIRVLDRELNYDTLAFLTEESREDAAIGEPFLNDRVYAYVDENGEIKVEKNPVYFISVADYESRSVELFLDEKGISYTIPYGVSAQAFLQDKNAPSGRYRIVESNTYGSTEYYAVYIRPGEIGTSVTVERIYNNNSVSQTLNILNAGVRLRANNFRITDVFNELDPYGLIKIKKNGGDALIYQLDEWEDIPVIDSEGNYEIILVDRLGNSISFYVDIYTSKRVYSFVLKDGNNTVLSENAYGGKKFTLPTLTSQNEKLEFAGWEDEYGNIYTDTYVFNSPKTVKLKALWHYKSVKVRVFDGEVVAEYSAKVGDLQPLPELKRDGYVLYGYHYLLNDGTVRFYRGQISSVPNEETVNLDAVWKREERLTGEPELGGEDLVKVSLIDGDIYSTVDMDREQIVDLPRLENKDGMLFYGWLYEYGLAGMIFEDKCSYGDIEAIGVNNESSVKLFALWVALDDGNTESAFMGATSDLGGSGADLLSGGSGSFVNGALMGGIALLATALLSLAIAFRRRIADKIISVAEKVKLKRVLPDDACECTDEAMQDGNYARRKEKSGRFSFNRLCRKAVMPFLSLFLAVTMLYFASYESIVYAVDEISYAVADAKQEKARKEANEIRTARLATALSKVQSSIGSEDGSLSISEEFIYSNVIVDLISKGYTDVFTAYAVVGSNTPETDDDRIVDGIGYTAYVDAYEVNGENIFGAGFVSLARENSLTKEEVESGVIIQVSEEEADYYEYTEFRLTANQIWGPIHYVAYEKYVNYQVLDYVVQYTITDDDGNYNDALGDVYSYDKGEYCHYVDYGVPFDFDVYGITSDMDYDEILQVLRDTMNTQLQNGIDITVEKADFISIQAINDYIAHNQEEEFLGVDDETLLYYEANITGNQYYIIYEDGTVGVLELPPDPEQKASIWERIASAVASIGVAIVGIVCCSIPGVGPILGGAIISAAIDVFMQTTIAGEKAENINWGSVATSAIIGAVSGGFGQAGGAISKVAVQKLTTTAAKFFAQLGIQTAAGMFGGAATYLTGALIRGEKLNFEDCMKAMALGAATNAIIFVGGQAISSLAGKIGAKNFSEFAKSSLAILGGSLSGLTSYMLAIAITGAEFSVEGLLLSIGMGAATAAIAIIGGKIVKTVKSAQQKRLNKDDTARLKQRISKDLPSGEDGSKWYFVDKKGNRIYKKDLLNDPYQEFYMVSATDSDIKMEVVNGYPQQSAIADADVYIKDGITTKRTGKGGNFRKFDEALADKWRMDHDLIPDDVKTYLRDIKHVDDFDYITALDIQDMRSSKTGLGYTWHESEDMHTAYLVKTDIHKTIKHSGGVERLQYLLQNAEHKKLEKLKMFNAIKNGS